MLMETKLTALHVIFYLYTVYKFINTCGCIIIFGDIHMGECKQR